MSNQSGEQNDAPALAIPNNEVSRSEPVRNLDAALGGSRLAGAESLPFVSDVAREGSDGQLGDADGIDAQAAKRRRGSRGGQRRKKPNGPRTRPTDGLFDAETDTDSDTYSDSDSDSGVDRRPADLPDHPREGMATGEAAQRAEVRPRIEGSRTPNGDASNGVASNGDVSGDDANGDDETGEQSSDQELASTGESGTPRPNNRKRRSRGGKGRGPKSTSTSTLNSTSNGPDARTDDRSDNGAPRAGVEPLSGIDTTSRRSARTPSNDARPPAEPRSEVRNERPAKTTNDRPRRGRRRGGEGESEGQHTTDVRRGRERNGKPIGRFLMCVHSHQKATQIAVLEGRSLTEHYVSRPADNTNQIYGNIYFGRVQNVLPGMEAAFVDIGTPKNAVLYRGDISFDAGDMEGGSKAKNDVRIEQLLKNRQMVLCQVTKNPIGTKGARLTQEVSIPGRFVVLVPNSETYGISKRLPDDERRRLRRILDGIRPAGHGLIVRTAAQGASEEELQRDVALLLKQWAAIDAKAKKANSPMLLHQEPDMAVRVIREEFNGNYRGIIIDNRELYEEIRSYVESISPELADRVEFHDTSTESLPLFEKHHIHEQLHKALDRKVWLPSGGSLIIERTEALTVIDVNTGKNVGSSSLEETVFRNNLEAGDEIARQLRLRDIGGIIVIDFIDMETRSNRDAVIRAFRDALSLDKTRTQVFDISELGLVEMTRKRISEGLVESLSESCVMCSGRGFIFDDELIQ